MFLHRLSSVSSSFLSQRPVVLLRSGGFRSGNVPSRLPLSPAPHPCWSAQGPPHWCLPPSRAASFLFSGTRARPWPRLAEHRQNIPPGNAACRFLARWCLLQPLLQSCAGSGGVSRTRRVFLGLMEVSSQGRAPPHKRWKSTGENKDKGERDGQSAGATGEAGGKSKETRSRRKSRSQGRGKSSSAKRRRRNRKESVGRSQGGEKNSSEGRAGRQRGRGMEPPLREEAPRQPHSTDHPPNLWLLAGVPTRTQAPPPGGHRNPPPPVAWRHPPPPGALRYPPPPGAWRHRTPPGDLRHPPPPGTLRYPTPAGTLRHPTPPGDLRHPPPPGTLRHPPPPGTLRHPTPPGALRHTILPGDLRHPPPPGALRHPPPTGPWRYPTPPGALRHPPPPGPWRQPPPLGPCGNPPPSEDFPPLPGPAAPQRSQGQWTANQPLQRHWDASPAQSANFQGSAVGAAFDFSVLSYNILSQELLQDNVYLYQHCDNRVLPWEFRLPNLLKEIQQYDADVLCLQEVQQDHYETQIKPALAALGYQCVYKKRTGEKPEGCAVVFKTSRLSLVSSHPLEYLRPGDTLLDRDNVGLVLLLRPIDARGESEASNCICVANTHLLYNPRRGDIKLAQLAILLAEITRLSRLPDGSTSPVVLCGDFNSTPSSPLYSFLTKGCLKYNGMPIGMVSGQENVSKSQRVLTVPIWSKSLGISQDCHYDNQPASHPPSTSPTEVEGAISNLTVEGLTAEANMKLVMAKRPSLKHSVRLQSSYSHLLMPDGRAEITTCHSRTAMTVDYILYTPDTMPSSLPAGRGLQLLGRLSLVGWSEIEAVNGLPNNHHSSDHLPLLARFRLHR